ncbi:hypothetical protein QTG54_005803 [Skeletonema marinoi]|uniref:Uncharacterized protein n=1 Tax=Skeletonema marinoi TaxID=267567 RepID=A0AAD8YCZ1_9STRA|nr:hypothetical protein QTG54_005803 [Skeletonema marinoi]
MGLVQSRTADLIFTMEPAFAGEQLFDPQNKGRIMALFRNPVDRLVNGHMGTYLQTGVERHDNCRMGRLPSEDENFMVRKLSGKRFSEPVNEMDLILAKEFLRQRVVVGLMGEMTESFRRFNIAMNVDVQRRETAEYFGVKDADSGVKNSNKHPKVVEGSPEWRALAKKNHLDIILYSYAERLFEEQKQIIDSYTAQDSENKQQERVEEQNEP